ncbi:probable zinc metalloprotease EGY2, chloroplastic isoform X2 [Chenopodium quinoa]|uniref:probable zinc metalloprotease EGY2, chloroplastic isoform X2 n=1 Tax=Chenopodium quinoa TaxID=63459 RepID=UPI000B772A70|nr:probable zinc metalloprotease EGY2, chloroplastic isoform X2 [Chenopodium quinoa]
MGIPTALRCNSSSLSQCTHCSVLRFQPLIVASSSLDFPRKFRRCQLRFLAVSRLGIQRKIDFVCRVGEDNIEPDTNDNKGKDNHEGNESVGSANSSTENDSQFEKEKEQVSTTEALNSLNKFLQNSQNSEIKVNGEGGSQEKEQVSTTEALNSLNKFIQNNQNNEIEVNGEGGTQDDPDDLQVSSGSPLPGVKVIMPQQLDETIRIPKETIDILRDQVFGFDTFFVTGQEPYEGGVLFKGNLRGVASESYEKLSKRLQDKLGDQYKLFMLINPEDDKPVAVVVPRITLQPETTAVPEWFAAGAFGLVTIFTLLLRNVPELQSNLLSSFDKLELLKNGLPGALVTALILGVHELGHYIVANDCGVKLGVPYFIPSWQIGSFGAITRIVNIVPKREDLLKVAAAGPLAGYSLGLILFFLGFILPPSDGLGIVVDGSVFHESLLVGGTAKLLLGDVLKEGQAISLNPLVLWAWAGLLINAINSIPAGELDGGRISFAIWGRKAAVRLTGASIVLLGLSSLFNDVAFYWVVLIYILQRGPIAPLSEEISEPDQKNVALGIAVLVLGLLVCLPYPFPFANEALTNL